MKCKICNENFYPTTYDTFYDMGHKYHLYICPWCEAENMYKVKININMNKIVDKIAIFITSLFIFKAINYISIHLDKFTIIFKN